MAGKIHSQRPESGRKFAMSRPLDHQLAEYGADVAGIPT